MERRGGRAGLRAIELDHNHSRARRWYGRFLGHMGRHAEAAEQIQKAIQLDPLSTATRDSAAMEWFYSRQYDRMIEEANKIRELDPLDLRVYEHLTVAYLFSGRSADARSAAQQGLALVPESPLFAILSAIVHERTGRRREASEMLQRIEKMAAGTHVPPVFLAVACTQLNRPEEALRWLERGLRTRDPYMMILNSSPWFDPLRGDQRFHNLLRRVGFSP